MNINRLLPIVIFSIAFFTAPGNGVAQTSDSITVHPIPETIITATRTQKNTDSVGRDVTVIRSAEIEKMGAVSLVDLLSKYSGISVIGTNQNPGMTQSLFMRGVNSNQTVIMIDGVPLNDPSSTNHALDLNELPLSNIDQIEIVRGSHSTLYGSSAIGGAINIITRKQMDQGVHANAKILGGTFGPKTYQVEENLFLNYTLKGGWFVNLDLFNTNIRGLDATVDTSSASADFKSFDSDDFDQQRLSGKIGYVDNHWDVFVAYAYCNTAADYDKSGFKSRSFDVPTTLYDGDSTRIFTKRNFTNYNIKYRTSPSLDIQLIGGYTTLLRTSVDDSSIINVAGDYDHTYSDGLYKGSEMNHELQADYKWKFSDLTGGVGFNNETMTSLTHYYNSLYQFEIINDLDSLDLHSTLTYAFAQLDFNGNMIAPSLSDLNIVFGLRYNHHQLFGSTLVYEINPSYRVGSIGLMYASYSTGFNTPSLYQLYAPDMYYTSDITRGNPGLKPEYSESAEIGIKLFPKNGLHFELSLYRTVVNNSIEYVYLWDTNIPLSELGNNFYRDDYRGDTYLNVGTQLNWGGEISFAAQLSRRISMDGNISIVKGRLQYSPNDIDIIHTESNHVQLYSNGAFPTTEIETKGLVRRPSTVNAAITFIPLKKTSVRLSGQWVSRYNDIYYDNTLGPFGALNTIPVDDYFLVDLLLRYDFNKNFTATIKSANILNTKYTEIRGFTTRGRAFYLTLAANF